MEDPRAYYLPNATIPEPFRVADQIQIDKHKNDPVEITEPVEIPVPIVTGPKTAKHKIIITKDWYVKEKTKKMKKQAKESRDYQIEMMQLLAERDRIRYKLGQLDITDRKDSKRIINYNIRLRDIEAELETLEKFSGINLEELDKGSRLGRFVGRIKRGVRKIVKKVKRFYTDHKDTIDGILCITGSLLLVGVVKKLRGWVSDLVAS